MNSTIKASLYFPPDMTDKPFMTDLVRDFGLVVNILQAEIMPGKRGKTVLDLSGEEENLERALTYLSQKGISVHIFSTSIIHNDDKCVDCGACVAVCPSGALSIKAPQWKLEFNNAECVRCKQCVAACPLGAINVHVFQ